MKKILFGLILVGALGIALGDQAEAFVSVQSSSPVIGHRSSVNGEQLFRQALQLLEESAPLNLFITSLPPSFFWSNQSLCTLIPVVSPERKCSHELLEFLEFSGAEMIKYNFRVNLCEFVAKDFSFPKRE